ncbi:MAG: phosphatidate cytidylyltransferase [Paracoccaceae bacterium]
MADLRAGPDSDSVAAPRAGSKFADLKTRAGPALIVSVLAGVCIWLGGFWIAAIAALAAGLMMAEWRSITGTRLDKPLVTGGIYIFTCGWVPLVAWAQGWGLAVFGLVALGLYGLIADWRRGDRPEGLWSMLGASYIGLAALAFVLLREVEPFGLISIVWAALVVVAADVGGYFAGRTFGGPKLWPAVSPKKTWSGLGGAIVLAFLTGGIFSWATTGTYFLQVCAVSVVAAVLAQAGDIAESALKRHFGVKDSGTILPGHGGVLDRLDGHMAAVLVAAAVTFSRGQPVFIW